MAEPGPAARQWYRVKYGRVWHLPHDGAEVRTGQRQFSLCGAYPEGDVRMVLRRTVGEPPSRFCLDCAMRAGELRYGTPA